MLCVPKLTVAVGLNLATLSFPAFRRIAASCRFCEIRVAFWHTSILPKKLQYHQKGVSKNRGGPPKWMVKIMENPFKMDDLGGKPTIFGNIQMVSSNPQKGLHKLDSQPERMCHSKLSSSYSVATTHFQQMLIGLDLFPKDQGKMFQTSFNPPLVVCVCGCNFTELKPITYMFSCRAQ